MNPKPELTDKWIKASVIGTTWAASEIVLGSFLHNLKIPFSGNILTSVGIIILISSSYKWNENGLFWRAGLICAIMKTMSPSALIFGPMIAIFSESLLLEISVRFLGKTIPGYIIGGMLAMSWNLFQKIINFIIFYGFDIVGIYSDLLKFTQKQLNIRFDIVWLPILFLLLVYCMIGIVAAIIGIRVGRKLTLQSSSRIPLKNPGHEVKQAGVKSPFNYSITWLFVNFCLIVAELMLLNFAPWYVWTASTGAIVLIWIARYKRALRQLSKPRFWFYFVLITMITAFVVNKMQSQSFEQGLMIGIQMNFRAIVIILGFSVLGTELYNPVIRNFFLRTSFRQLPLALELSFESLPAMIANLPDFKVFIKNPGSVVFQILSQIDFRLGEIKELLECRIYIITGAVGEGKTSHIMKLAGTLRDRNLSVAGILSPRIMEQGKTTGYDILDLATNHREPLLRKTPEPGAETIGCYTIIAQGFASGCMALQKAHAGHYQYVVIDEIGKLELDDKGWASNLDELIHHSRAKLILSVRDTNLEPFLEKWNVKNYKVFRLAERNQFNTFVVP